MATFTESDDLRGAQFSDVNLSGSRFVRSDLSGAVMRVVYVAWTRLADIWAATLRRAAALPPGTEDVTVDGEWSLAQTLRHLVMATDKWLGGAAMGLEQPYHPIGVPNDEYETDGLDMSVFQTAKPSYDEVLGVRAGRATTQIRNPWQVAISFGILAVVVDLGFRRASYE